MQVIDLLLEHLLGDDLLGMKPLLPDLIIAPGLGRTLVLLELIQDPGLLIPLQSGDKALGGVAFEIPDDIRQFRPGHHQVQMVAQDGLCIDSQALMPAAKLEGVQENVEIGFPGEDGKPFYHCAGDEVRGVGLFNGVAGSHGARRLTGGEAVLRLKMAFPS